MKDLTTHEHLKGYYAEFSFSPFSSGFGFKNLFRRMFEHKPNSMLIKEIRFRDKISVHDTKASLERKQDIKKIVLDTREDDEEKRRQMKG